MVPANVNKCTIQYGDSSRKDQTARIKAKTLSLENNEQEYKGNEILDKILRTHS